MSVIGVFAGTSTVSLNLIIDGAEQNASFRFALLWY